MADQTERDALILEGVGKRMLKLSERLRPDQEKRMPNDVFRLLTTPAAQLSQAVEAARATAWNEVITFCGSRGWDGAVSILSKEMIGRGMKVQE